MDDLDATLLRLTQNLACLKEREAKYAGQAPLGLFNQIEDYQTALIVVKQVRTGQLVQVDLEVELARLNLDVTISGLRGMGSIGKTALALNLDLRGAGPIPLTPAEALAHVIRAYHPTVKLSEREADLVDLPRFVLHGQAALLLFDNTANAAQLESLLPSPDCALLVTSRYYLPLEGGGERVAIYEPACCLD